jgi:hypothetical protein
MVFGKVDTNNSLIRVCVGRSKMIVWRREQLFGFRLEAAAAAAAAAATKGERERLC